MTTHSQAAAGPTAEHGGGHEAGGHGGDAAGGDGGTQAIIAALLANLGIAVSKVVAFLVTGASSMLAGGIPFLADSRHPLLLLLGGPQGQRAGPPPHPF